MNCIHIVDKTMNLPAFQCYQSANVKTYIISSMMCMNKSSNFFSSCEGQIVSYITRPPCWATFSQTVTYESLKTNTIDKLQVFLSYRIIYSMQAGSSILLRIHKLPNFPKTRQVNIEIFRRNKKCQILMIWSFLIFSLGPIPNFLLHHDVLLQSCQCASFWMGSPHMLWHACSISQLFHICV